MDGLALLEGARAGEAVAPGARGIGAEVGVAVGGATLHPARVHESGGEEKLAAEGEADALFEGGELVEVACMRVGGWGGLVGAAPRTRAERKLERIYVYSPAGNGCITKDFLIESISTHQLSKMLSLFCNVKLSWSSNIFERVSSIGPGHPPEFIMRLLVYINGAVTVIS